MNMIERGLRARFEVEKQVKFDISDLDKVELIDTDILDEKERSQTFFELRKRFLDLEKDTIKLSAAKREILFRKMNKLAQHGLVDINQKPGQEEPIFPTTPKERIEKAIQMGRFAELKKKTK